MGKFIKNNSGSQGTWKGKVFEDQEYREISDSEVVSWGNDSSVLSSIGNGDLIVAKDDSGNHDITDIAQAINYLKNVPNDMDESGRVITRQAATQKGWHYQAHSIQFEVNKLDSIYNKDRNGNDLGFSSMKIYDDQGNELTTQASVDTDGCKTVIKWQPTYDIEVISGNIRQVTKETVDSYIYVDAVIPTGYPAPYDKLYVPFTQGGINLNYIGADESLKTDGRAAKLIPCSLGAYFEITVNYEPNLLNNENRHKMSIIFETYKSV